MFEVFMAGEMEEFEFMVQFVVGLRRVTT